VPPYDPVNDFTPVSLVGIFGFFIFSHASVPRTTIGECRLRARQSGELNYGPATHTACLANRAIRRAETSSTSCTSRTRRWALSID